MKCWLIFVMIATVAPFALCDQSMILEETEACSDTSFQIFTVLAEFFKGQEILTVIRDYSKEAQFHFNVFTCIIRDLKITYVKYTNLSILEEHQPIDDINYLSTPRSTYCYLVITDSFKTINADISVLAKINPTAKFAFLFTNSSIPETEIFVTAIWSGYKMKNCISMVPDEGETELGMSGDLNIITYNPFEIDDGVRGVIYNFTANATNCRDVALEVAESITRHDNNMHKMPVRVYMYEWQAFAKAVYSRKNPGKVARFELLDGELLQMFAKTLNFTPIFTGNVSNNSFQGSIYVIENELADIAFNSRMLSDYETENTVFLRPLDLIDVKYMVPKRHSTRALNVFVYSLFDLEAEVTMTVVFIVMILVWFIMNFTYEKFIMRTGGNSLPKSLLIVTATQYFASINLPKVLSGHQQIMLGCMLIYGILVSSNYQSSVVKQLSTKVSDDDLNTLKKLADSDLNFSYVPTFENFLLLPENFGQNSVIYKLFSRQQRLNETLSVATEEIAMNKTSGVLCTGLVARDFQAVMFDPHTGRDLIYVCPESPPGYYVSYIVPKTSPYRVRFNEIIFIFIEAGFVLYETRRVMNNVQLKYVTRAKISFEQGATVFQPISPEQMRSLFYVWSYILTVSIFIFIIEILVNSYKKKQQRGTPMGRANFHK